jgi:hypothetical protein
MSEATDQTYSPGRPPEQWHSIQLAANEKRVASLELRVAELESAAQPVDFLQRTPNGGD